MINFTEKRVDQIGVAVLVTLAALVLFLLSTTFGWRDNNVNEIDPTISVYGEGRAFATPDTAVFTYAVTERAETAEAASAAMTSSLNSIQTALIKAGVAAEDIKTESYNVYPQYEYRTDRVEPLPAAGGIEPAFYPPYPVEGTEVLVGYEANQVNEVRVRNATNAGSLLALATENGADVVSQLGFVVWDETAVQAEAQQLAIDDARNKAKALADQLGVRLGKIQGFYDESQVMYGQYAMDAKMEMSVSDEAGATGAPASISVGQNEIFKRVSITFEIR